MAKADIVEKVKSVLTTPSKFFASVKSEKDYPLVYLLVLSAVSVILGSLMTGVAAGMTIALVAAPIAFVFSIIGAFIGAGVIHIFVMLLGGKGGFVQTFKSYVYGSTPSMLLSWIPFVGLLAGLYSLFYLIPKGISVQQNMSMGRAVLAIVIPIIIVIIIAFVIAAAVVLAFFAALSSGQVPAAL